MGNTSSIPAFFILSLVSKSRAESPCPIMRCCPKLRPGFRCRKPGRSICRAIAVAWNTWKLKYFASFVGRGHDPADPVPVFGLYVKWNYFPQKHGKCQENWNLIPFSEPGRFRYLIGGVMTPPYENIPSNNNFKMLHTTTWFQNHKNEPSRVGWLVLLEITYRRAPC